MDVFLPQGIFRARGGRKVTGWVNYRTKIVNRYPTTKYLDIKLKDVSRSGNKGDDF